ncbi:hypothetical protein FN846DRAFT_989747 [Sphaerosporella brunnea]|uniref:Uncharacterized protein n=1 Tax=Sphaerosporella brunnea TaxID=1250544 RepID=A0A5J5EQ87_9PEZI|nr:hypothetical protein FN846DRAFT_989747 [Sphaerosporella brunnea]
MPSPGLYALSLLPLLCLHLPLTLLLLYTLTHAAGLRQLVKSAFHLAGYTALTWVFLLTLLSWHTRTLAVGAPQELGGVAVVLCSWIAACISSSSSSHGRRRRAAAAAGAVAATEAAALAAGYFLRPAGYYWIYMLVHTLSTLSCALLLLLFAQLPLSRRLSLLLLSLGASLARQALHLAPHTTNTRYVADTLHLLALSCIYAFALLLLLLGVPAASAPPSCWCCCARDRRKALDSAAATGGISIPGAGFYRAWVVGGRGRGREVEEGIWVSHGWQVVTEPREVVEARDV